MLGMSKAHMDFGDPSGDKSKVMKKSAMASP